jgi:hypothetical protein
MLDFVGRQMLFVDCSVIAERASLAEECGGAGATLGSHVGSRRRWQRNVTGSKDVGKVFITFLPTNATDPWAKVDQRIPEHMLHSLQ